MSRQAPSGEELIRQARALEHANQPVAAEAAYRRALKALPEAPDLLRHIGLLNVRLGRNRAARGFLERSVAAAPVADTLLMLAGVCVREGDRHAAAAACQQAIAREPDNAAAQLEMALVQVAMADYAAAETHLRAALRIDPRLHTARLNLGAALCAQGRFGEAIAEMQAALRVRPDDALTWKNLATAQRGLGAHAEAAASYRTAIRHAPDFAEAHRDLGLSLMLQDQYAEGMAEYEWRHRARLRGAEPLPGARWRGEPMRGTLLVHFEQGLGDTLHFLRFVPAAAARVGRLLLCVQQSVAPLASGIAPNFDIIVHGARLPRYDAYAYLMSLPLLLNADGPPSALVPYLIPPSPPHVIPARSARLRVGLVWAGSTLHEDDRNRSIPPDLLAPLLTLTDVEWIALQPGADRPIGIAAPPWPLQNFADTASLLRELDLVITVDTAVAHLAGALGAPVWLLLAWVPDWRWGVSGETSRWYPGMRLYRQTQAQDWPGVIARVKHDLEALHPAA